VILLCLVVAFLARTIMKGAGVATVLLYLVAIVSAFVVLWFNIYPGVDENPAYVLFADGFSFSVHPVSFQVLDIIIALVWIPVCVPLDNGSLFYEVPMLFKLTFISSLLTIYIEWTLAYCFEYIICVVGLVLLLGQITLQSIMRRLLHRSLPTNERVMLTLIVNDFRLMWTVFQFVAVLIRLVYILAFFDNDHPPFGVNYIQMFGLILFQAAWIPFFLFCTGSLAIVVHIIVSVDVLTQGFVPGLLLLPLIVFASFNLVLLIVSGVSVFRDKVVFRNKNFEWINFDSVGGLIRQPVIESTASTLEAPKQEDEEQQQYYVTTQPTRNNAFGKRARRLMTILTRQKQSSD
jgi:hypothetical protein